MGTIEHISETRVKTDNIEDGQKREMPRKTKIIIYGSCFFGCIIIAIVIAGMVTAPAPKSYWFPSGESESRLGVYHNASVATDAAPCARIGRDILIQNGSAVDSAIAMLVCMGAVNPVSQGLGGGFLMTVYQKSTGKPYFFDAREMAPLNAHADMFNANTSLSEFGGLSIAVPGELAGYAHAHEKFGKLPWKELFLPTVRLCREGFPLSKYMAKKMKDMWYLIVQHLLLRIFLTNTETNKTFQAGETMFCNKLADTLEIIAKDGKNALYDPAGHPLARSFLKDMKDMGSIITEKDMQSYQVRTPEPLRTTLRNNMTVFTSPIPGSGALLIFMLNVLSGYNVSKENVKTKDGAVLLLHRMLETFKYAYAKRMFLDDKPSVLPLILNLTSNDYANSIRSMIDDSKSYEDPLHYFNGDVRIARDDHGTAHTCVLDSNGDAVSVTSTVNFYFGSMMLSPSTGIILNNEMGDFSIPNVTSYYGVPPSNHNMIEPRKRPLSSMSPTIIIDRDGDARLVIGGSGGTKITSGILQIIFRNVWLEENIKKAIDAPRFYQQLIPNKVKYEKDFPKKLMDGLEKKNHKTDHSSFGMLGVMVGIARDERGLINANSDFRKDGEVDGF